MSYEEIKQATASLTRIEQLKLIEYIANLLIESEEKAEQKAIFEAIQERKNTPASEYISYDDAMKM